MEKFKQATKLSGYSTNFDHIKKYDLSLPARKSKKIKELSAAQLDKRLEYAIAYYIYGFRKFNLVELKKKYSLNALQARELCVKLTAAQDIFIKGGFGNAAVSDKVLAQPVRVVPTLDERLRLLRDKHSAEIKVRGEHSKFLEGFLYILNNPAFPGWVKVGMTIDYDKRIRSYNIPNDPHQKFAYLKIKWTTNRRAAESAMLEKFGSISLEQKGEWFRIDKNTALSIFEN